MKYVQKNKGVRSEKTLHRQSFDDPMTRRIVGASAGVNIGRKIVIFAVEHGGSSHPPGLDTVALHLMTEVWPYRKWAAHLALSEANTWIQQFAQAYMELKTSGDFGAGVLEIREEGR